MSKIHTFEEQGLGKGPFKFVGVWEAPPRSLAASNPSAYNHALATAPKGISLGCCDYCLTAIRIHCLIESSCGNVFAVGTTCVEKTGDKGLIDTVKRANRDRIRERKRLAAEKAREEELDRQRQANGGLTDREIEQQKHEALVEACREEIRPLIAEIQGDINVLLDRWESVGEGLSRCEEPRGRGWDIALEILGKEAGRRGSDAYWEAYEAAEERLETFRAMYTHVANKHGWPVFNEARCSL